MLCRKPGGFRRDKLVTRSQPVFWNFIAAILEWRGQANALTDHRLWTSRRITPLKRPSRRECLWTDARSPMPPSACLSTRIFASMRLTAHPEASRLVLIPVPCSQVPSRPQSPVPGPRSLFPSPWPLVPGPCSLFFVSSPQIANRLPKSLNLNAKMTPPVLHIINPFRRTIGIGIKRETSPCPPTPPPFAAACLPRKSLRKPPQNGPFHPATPAATSM